jgi:Rps23 Pro-64 3,4-dihydroxylase Tpa1-like proline 4-hydroxylase
MTVLQASRYSSDLTNNGLILISAEDGFLTKNEFERLEQLADSLPVEHIEIGDADEPNYLEVGRFMTDQSESRIVNDEVAKQALLILASDEKFAFYKKLLNSDELYIRRMQYNVMVEGCFIGVHLDTDSNPDYLVAVVIQFSEKYDGGEFVLHKDSGEQVVFKTEKFSTLISNCSIKHEVKKVKQGFRKSLVFFLSEHGGLNRRSES